MMCMLPRMFVCLLDVWCVILLVCLTVAPIRATPLGDVRAVADASPTVHLTSGAVQGVLDSLLHVNLYLGIPFAAAPVGARRFEYAQPVDPWAGVRSATQFPQPCMQRSKGKVSGNEDCLYLNVFQTAINITQPLCSMVFFYGGSFVTGDSYNSGLYDGSNYVSNHPDLLLVTSNYRLGALGFLALQELADNSTRRRTGNYAIDDQLTVLKWVQSNIAAFGGNPECVTIFGESAGAFSVSTHLASPLSAGLFQRAIVESGAGLIPSYFRPLQQNLATSTSFVQQHTQCTQYTGNQLVACLRAAPADSFIATDLSPCAVTLDGIVLSEQPVYAIGAGDWNQVPIIVGTNFNESGKFLASISSATYAVFHNTSIPLSFADLPQAIQVSLGWIPGITLFPLDLVQQWVDMIEHTYDFRMFQTATHYMDRVWTDAIFRCPANLLATNVMQQGEKAWLYEFHYNASDYSGYQQYGDFHGLELCYVYDNLIIFDHDDWRMMNVTQGYWSSFAVHADPNASGLGPDQIPWSVYDGQQLELALPTTISQYDAQYCQMWYNIWKQQRQSGVCDWC